MSLEPHLFEKGTCSLTLHPFCHKTYLLTQWSRVLLEKLTGFQLVTKFPAFYGTRKFMTAVTSAYCLTVSQHMFLLGGVVSTSPKPQAGGPPLVGCPRLLIQYIRSYHPYLRPFLHSQPENTPCRGDRDPLITACHKSLDRKCPLMYNPSEVLETNLTDCTGTRES
jgi:hypothetical protein